MIYIFAYMIRSLAFQTLFFIKVMVFNVRRQRNESSSIMNAHLYMHILHVHGNLLHSFTHNYFTELFSQVQNKNKIKIRTAHFSVEILQNS